MSEKLFEVFLGTYNAEPWIASVIHALESQDSEPFSVKIIDNASTDNTTQIIEKLFSEFTFKNKYELIKNESNIGPISSFLDRLEVFESEWIVMIHQDDYYHPNHISTLINGIKGADSEVGVVFTAMQRMNNLDEESLSIPSLSKLTSEKNRIENFLLTLQISPINYPATALKKSILSKVTTSRHTTAFNDVELLLRMMCLADVKYVAKETMHYRVYPGNASSITSTNANDLAIMIGLVELFHSMEFQVMLNQISVENKWTSLIDAIESCLEIRIKDLMTKKVAKLLLAESLIRNLGYSQKHLVEFLVAAQLDLGLTYESINAKNLATKSTFKTINKSKNDAIKPNYVDSNFVTKPHGSNYFFGLFNKLPLSVREKGFNIAFKSPLFFLVKRPFVKVWRSKDRRG